MAKVSGVNQPNESSRSSSRPQRVQLAKSDRNSTLLSIKITSPKQTLSSYTAVLRKLVA